MIVCREVKAVQCVLFTPVMLLCPEVRDEGVQSLLVQGVEGWPEAVHRAAEESALGIGPHRPHQVARKLHWDGASQSAASMACINQQPAMRQSSFMPGHAAEATSQQQVRIQLLSVLWQPVNMQELTGAVH